MVLRKTMIMNAIILVTAFLLVHIPLYGAEKSKEEHSVENSRTRTLITQGSTNLAADSVVNISPFTAPIQEKGEKNEHNLANLNNNVASGYQLLGENRNVILGSAVKNQKVGFFGLPEDI